MGKRILIYTTNKSESDLMCDFFIEHAKNDMESNAILSMRDRTWNENAPYRYYEYDLGANCYTFNWQDANSMSRLLEYVAEFHPDEALYPFDFLISKIDIDPSSLCSFL